MRNARASCFMLGHAASCSRTAVCSLLAEPFVQPANSIATGLVAVGEKVVCVIPADMSEGLWRSADVRHRLLFRDELVIPCELEEERQSRRRQPGPKPDRQRMVAGAMPVRTAGVTRHHHEPGGGALLRPGGPALVTPRLCPTYAMRVGSTSGKSVSRSMPLRTSVTS